MSVFQNISAAPAEMHAGKSSGFGSVKENAALGYRPRVSSHLASEIGLIHARLTAPVRTISVPIVAMRSVFQSPCE